VLSSGGFSSFIELEQLHEGNLAAAFFEAVSAGFPCPYFERENNNRKREERGNSVLLTLLI